MGQTRPFEEKDIPQVIGLHRRVFATRGDGEQELASAYRSYFEGIFLKNPWYDQGLPSLVYQDADGEIIGFLGVMSRRMSMNGRPLRAAITSQFMVEPGRRSTLAGIELVKAFLSGPQDLSLADEASHAARKLWESLGGTTALLYSIQWARLLRPTRFVISQLGKRRGLASVAFASMPFCDVVDAAAARMAGSPCRQVRPAVSAEDLNAKSLLACVSESGRSRSLRPEYDERSLGWLLDILAQKEGCGTFQKVLVRNKAGEGVGWYLCYLNPGGMGEVLQVGAKNRWITEVLDHLFYHAWRQGATALSGRVEPGFIQEFAERGCFFHHRGQWMLVHARERGLLEAIHRGDAFLTRLEGEWCMRFRGGYG